MPAFNDGFLNLPHRPGKPRTEGLTHVIDKGLNLRDIEGMFDTGGQFVDIVKLGWGTSYVTNNLEKKIALYRSFETPVVCGGTLFEAVYGRGRLAEFKQWGRETLSSKPLFALVQAIPAVTGLEQRPAADDGRLERPVEGDLLLQVVRDVRRPPAE